MNTYAIIDTSADEDRVLADYGNNFSSLCNDLNPSHVDEMGGVTTLTDHGIAAALIPYYSTDVKRNARVTITTHCLDFTLHPYIKVGVRDHRDETGQWSFINPDRHVWVPERILEHVKHIEVLGRLPYVTSLEDSSYCHLSFYRGDEDKSAVLRPDEYEVDALNSFISRIVGRRRYDEESSQVLNDLPVDVYYPTLRTVTPRPVYKPLLVTKTYDQGWVYRRIDEFEFYPALPNTAAYFTGVDDMIRHIERKRLV